MKKTRLFIALLVMLVAASSYAQDSYRETVKQFVSANGQIDRMQSAFTTMNETFFKKTEGVDLNALTERYVKERLNDQMTDLVLPMMKERNVTEAELRALNEMLATPKFQTFLTHQNEWIEKLSQISEECISQLIDGEEPENIQLNPDIDAGYAAKFQKMWKESGKEEKSIGLYNKLSLDENTEEFAKIGKCKTWLADNLGTIALNAAYGTLTLEDFDLGMELYTNESYRKATDTSDLNVFSVVGPTAEIIIKYLDWMESQGAQPSEKFLALKVLMQSMNYKP